MTQLLRISFVLIMLVSFTLPDFHLTFAQKANGFANRGAKSSSPQKRQNKRLGSPPVYEIQAPREYYMRPSARVALTKFRRLVASMPIPLYIDRDPRAFRFEKAFLGDRCYPSNQAPTESELSRFADPTYYRPSLDVKPRLQVVRPSRESKMVQHGVFYPFSYFQKRAISDVENLDLISDIVMAGFKNKELIVIGPKAPVDEGFQLNDWYAVFRSLAGTEAPGVSIDPGPDQGLMQVRFFGGIENTDLGFIFFEADLQLKNLSSGFDNYTCEGWSGFEEVPFELELMEEEIDTGNGPNEGDGRWHRYWLEMSGSPVETNGLIARFPQKRLVVKEETVPAGGKSRESSRRFASLLSERFLEVAKGNSFARGNLAFEGLQRGAALVMLAKWIRDKQIPVDESWIKGSPSWVETPTTTPSITVLRTKRLSEERFLSLGVQGGIDLQKDNRYTEISAETEGMWSQALQQRPSSSQSFWLFTFNGTGYAAISLKLPRPIPLRTNWITKRHVVSTYLVPPRTQVHAPAAVRIPDRSSTGLGSVVPPRTTGSGGSFIVENNTGGELTVNVGGQLHTVNPGRSSIRLQSGRYSVTIGSRCGTATQNFEIRNGSTYTGQYSCDIMPRR